MIDSNYFIINVVLLVIGTIIIRGGFIALSGKFNISPKIKELFTFIPAAIFPVIIVPAIYFHQGSIAGLMRKERFVVLAASGIVCYFIRNTMVVISFGLVALYLITQL